MRNISLLFLTLLLSLGSASAEKYYVGTEAQWGDRTDGTIVATIPTPAAGDEIWIATGEYITASIPLANGVKFYGGFAGTETTVDDRAKVDGGKPWEFAGPTVWKNSAATILNTTAAAAGITNLVIDGIVFDGIDQAGRAINIAPASGANANSNHSIRNCIVRNFQSGADGGGLNVRTGTEIYNCLITDNTGNKGGGGYFDFVTLHDSEITNI